MPIIVHKQPDNEERDTEPIIRPVDGSSPIENLLVRIGIGLMTGIVSLFFAFEFFGRSYRLNKNLWWIMMAGGGVGFLIGFVLGDNMPEDWFERLYGRWLD